jgi:hypothetical protein
VVRRINTIDNDDILAVAIILASNLSRPEGRRSELVITFAGDIDSGLLFKGIVA